MLADARQLTCSKEAPLIAVKEVKVGSCPSVGCEHQT